MEIEALNSIGASIGDTVVIGFETSPLMKLTFLLYVFPIIFLIIGAVIGQTIAPRFNMTGSGLSVICSFVFFLIAFVVIRITGKQLAEKTTYRAKITRITARAQKISSK